MTVKVNGLPAGLKADPVDRRPRRSRSSRSRSSPTRKAAAATAAASVALAFQVNKKDYPTPPAPLAVKVVRGEVTRRTVPGLMHPI